MRIALFAESYYPVVNGAAAAVQWLAQELSSEHEVVVFAPHFPGCEDRDVRVYRLPSYLVPGHRDYPLAVRWSPTGYRWFRDQHFDIVHSHSPFTVGEMGRRWARRTRIPVVTTYHTLYVEYAHYFEWAPRWMVRNWLRFVSRSYCSSCDQVAVPTAPIRDVLLQYGVSAPVSVVPTGLPSLVAVQPDAGYPRQALGIAPDAQIVLYAGRLAKEKNLSLLFDAFAKIAARCPRAHFLVAGSGPEEETARQSARDHGLTHRVTFTGFIGRDELRKCYADASVLAFASLTDTQGLVIIEAKAQSLPAVSINAYGPGTVVRNGVDGLLVENDVDQFAGAVLSILDDPDTRSRLGAAAREDAVRFRIETTARQYLDLYHRALKPAQLARDREASGNQAKARCPETSLE